MQKIFIQGLILVLLISSCSSSLEKLTYETVSDLHYQGLDLIFVAHNDGKDQIYRNGNPEGKKFDRITFLRNWNLLGDYPSVPIIQFINSGQTHISYGGRISENFDEIRNFTEDIKFPIFVARNKGKEYSLSGIEIQGDSYDTISSIQQSENNQHYLISGVRDGEGVMNYDGKYLTGINAVTFQSDGSSILYVKTSGSQESQLMKDDNVIFTWSGVGVIGSLLGGENVNVLELGSLGGDGEGTGDDAFIQYIINGVPHEKTKLLNEIHAPFFGESLFIYPFKKNNTYFFNANNKIYGPYMSYPHFQIFGDKKRFIAVGKVNDYTVDLIVDNEKIGVFGNIGDIGFSPDKNHYSYSRNNKIVVDGAEKDQLFIEGEVGPMIDNSGNVVSYYGMRNGQYVVMFNDKIVYNFPIESNTGFINIKPVLNNKHYILYGNDVLTIDGKLIPGFHGTDPHRTIECGDSVIALENIRPPDEISQLLIWTPKQQFIRDNSYSPVFSKDCSKVAYITRDKERVGVRELHLK